MWRSGFGFSRGGRGLPVEWILLADPLERRKNQSLDIMCKCSNYFSVFRMFYYLFE